MMAYPPLRTQDHPKGGWAKHGVPASGLPCRAGRVPHPLVWKRLLGPVSALKVHRCPRESLPTECVLQWGHGCHLDLDGHSGSGEAAGSWGVVQAPQHLSQGPDCGSQRGGQSRVLCGSCQLQGSLTAPEDGRKLPAPTWKTASFCSFWLWFRLGVALAALLSACLGKQLDPQSGSSRSGPAWSSGDHLQGEMKTQHPGPKFGQSHVKGAEIESSFPLTAVYVLIDGVLNLLFDATLRKGK